MATTRRTISARGPVTASATTAIPAATTVPIRSKPTSMSVLVERLFSSESGV
jgi:hypothetical protein